MYDYKCDVKLKVGTESFRAHKDVLSDSSFYFEAMFSHDMLEKGQGEIEMHEISSVGFSVMMEYFYHGHVTLSPTNIADVLEAARFFHIDWLIRACCDFLIRRLSVENYESVVELADRFYLGDLRHDIFSNISSQFMSLAKDPTFMSISYDLLHTILAEDYYIDAPERFILQTVLRWLDHKTETEDREKYALPLLRLVRYCLIEVSELEEVKVKLQDVAELSDMIDYAIKYHANPTAQCLKASAMTGSRGATKALVLIGSNEFDSHFQYKIPGTCDFLTEAIDLPYRDLVLEFASVAALGNFLFVAGGYEASSWCSSATFCMYDPRYRNWAKLTPMRTPRVSFPLVAGADGLYAVAGIEHIVQGGRDVENYLDTVEFYNPNSNTWSFLPELPFGMFSCAATCSTGNGGKLYVSGGVSARPEDHVPTSYLHAFVQSVQAWVPLEDMQVPRQAHAMVAHDNKLLVCGGYTNNPHNTMHLVDCLQNEIYDIGTNQWSFLRGIIDVDGHLYNAVTTFDDKIYVLGGPSSSAARFLHALDPEKDSLQVQEYCGQSVQQLTTLSVSLPPECIPNDATEQDDDDCANDDETDSDDVTAAAAVPLN